MYLFGEEFVHAVWRTLHYVQSTNVDRVNNAKIQTDVTNKPLLHFTYLKYFVYVHISVYLLNLVFIHEDA